MVSEVYDYLKETGGDRAGVAKRLVALAKERRSSDNISVIVIFLREKLAIPASRSQDMVAVSVEEDEKMMEGSQDFSEGFDQPDESKSSEQSSNINDSNAKDVSDSSSKAVKGESPVVSSNILSSYPNSGNVGSGNVDSAKLQGGVFRRITGVI